MSARGNGLRASAYAPLTEVDETTGSRLLDALAERSIAAYLAPAPGSAAGGRLVLHVDASRRVPARIVLAGLTPAHAADAGGDDPAAGTGTPPTVGAEPVGAGQPQGSVRREDTGPAGAETGDDAVDALFAQLVAGFHDAPAVRSWPDAEDLPREPPTAEPDAGSPAARPGETRGWDPSSDPDRRRRPAGPGSTRPGQGDNAAEAAADDANNDPGDILPARPRPRFQPPAVRREPVEPDPELDDSHYVPPHLPRLKPASTGTRWAFAAMALGLALLLVPTLFALDHTTSTDIAGVAFVLGATAFLLTKLRPDSEPPDGPDNGAVV